MLLWCIKFFEMIVLLYCYNMNTFLNFEQKASIWSFKVD